MTATLAESVVKPTGVPQYCSCCFRQDATLQHVDFNSACDRGWYGGDAATEVAMDDLILCENCVREGAGILGMVNPDTDRIAELERKLDIEEKLRKQAQNYADTMEEALSKRPEKVHIDHRKKPRPLRTQED